MITRGSILWILEIVWPLYILASHLLCYVLQYCSLCNTWTINLSINLFVCLRGGELHRSVCRNQKCRTVITLGGVLVHYHQDLASRPMSVSPLSLLTFLRLFSAPAQVYGTFRLSWCRCSPGTVCWMRWFSSKDTHSSISPARDLAGKLRSQSILQRKLRISQDMCRPWHQSVLCWAASTQ